MVLFSLLLSLGMSAGAKTYEFDGAIGLKICPRASECFRNIKGTPIKIDLTEILNDAGQIVETGYWEAQVDVQGQTLLGSVEINSIGQNESNFANVTCCSFMS